MIYLMICLYLVMMRSVPVDYSNSSAVINTNGPIDFNIDDVVQTSHGDCWLEATIAAYSLPGATSPLPNIVSMAPSGDFNVTLYERPPAIVTNQECLKYEGKNCTWSVAIEVAINRVDPSAVANGSSVAHAVEFLTGYRANFKRNPTDLQSLTNRAVAITFHKSIDQISKSNQELCSSNGIDFEHAYTIVHIENDKFTLRNPHGGAGNGYQTFSRDVFNQCFVGITFFQ